ncbi:MULTISPECIES: hypothetical protein [unclassified Sphingomonas]|uniref:hypothetical protein n=1 Tax=unclassified Sphingomonas TaxID=196159 RepID=UPI002150B9D2|nr:MULTISPECIES: hypothetical protein [unclassified Sphingomonas]MCR5870636.1 hypothetical protein [Sphingomonas sp. J344]UUY01023.1 hypothetical protein LRS08_08225 [Sphingomonas sp. J315]
MAATPIVAPIAVLLATAAVRQSASPTARLQIRLDRRTPAHGLLAPPHGAFNLAVERTLTRWQRQ